MNDASDNPEQLPPAPLWRHVFAMLYDTLLVVPLFMAAAAVWVAILGPTESIEKPAVPAALQWASWIVILVAFFGIFWRRAGQTLGMQAWRIKLISDSSEPLSWHHVIVRVLGALLASPLVLAISGAMCRRTDVTGTILGPRLISSYSPNAISDEWVTDVQLSRLQ